MRTFRSRPDQLGRARSRHLAERFGQDLRIARAAVGLTQERLGRRAGVSQQMVSQAELGDPAISLDIRCRLAAGCAHELGWRLYPAGNVTLRDSGQLAIAQRISTAAHPSWAVALEVPVGQANLRAADLVLSNAHERIHIEIERMLVDAQAQIRSAQLKRDALTEHDDRPVRLVIAVPDSRAARLALAPIAALIDRALPARSRHVWSAIRNGQPLGGDGILFVRATHTAGSGTRAPEAL